MRALAVLGLLSAIARADIAAPSDAIGLRTAKCQRDTRAWNVDVTVDLMLRTDDKRAMVSGTVSWRDRRTRAELRGPRAANMLLEGTLSEIGGLGTVWNVQLSASPRTRNHWHVVLIELVDKSEPAIICMFDT
jgi:hypothetical protein